MFFLLFNCKYLFLQFYFIFMFFIIIIIFIFVILERTSMMTSATTTAGRRSGAQDW